MTEKKLLDKYLSMHNSLEQAIREAGGSLDVSPSNLKIYTVHELMVLLCTNDIVFSYKGKKESNDRKETIGGLGPARRDTLSVPQDRPENVL